MTRNEMIERIGRSFLTANIENDEYSYVQEAGSKSSLEKAVGHTISHFKLDIRFQKEDTVVLVETKQNYVKSDEAQLSAYLEEEIALHKGMKIICILANTHDSSIKVWKNKVDDSSLLINETVLDTMEHYAGLFNASKQNDRERVMKNTYDLNELLHKMDIDEKLRSQFVGTSLLYIKDIIRRSGLSKIDETLISKLKELWLMMSPEEIRTAIKKTLTDLLDGSENKSKKIELLQQKILNNQKVKRLTL